MLILFSRSDTGFRLVSKSMTLNNLEPRIRVVQQWAAISGTAAVMATDVSRRYENN